MKDMKDMRRCLYHAQMNMAGLAHDEIFFVQEESYARVAYVHPETWGIRWYNDLQINLSDVSYVPRKGTPEHTLAMNMAIITARMCHTSPDEWQRIQQYDRGLK